MRLLNHNVSITICRIKYFMFGRKISIAQNFSSILKSKKMKDFEKYLYLYLSVKVKDVIYLVLTDTHKITGSFEIRL